MTNYRLPYEPTTNDPATVNQLWKDPDWECPRCHANSGTGNWVSAQPSPLQSGATERAAIMEISRTCGDRSLSEIDLRVKIIGICHGVLVPQLSGNSGEMKGPPKVFPRCKCGGVATTNASGDITRTCIRCGAIVKPTTEKQG